MKNNHTFVICTYKDSPYLEECIRALECQTIKSDIIISTSTPTPNVEKLAELHNIPLYTHNQGGSIGKDWNYGFAIPKTKYLTLAHQDDVFLKDFLETNITKLEENKGAVLAFTNYSEIDKNSKIIRKNRNIKIKNLMLIPIGLFDRSSFVRNCIFSFGNPICSPTITYNMNILSGFRFSETICAAIDWEAFYRINKIRGKWIYTDEILMYHRIHDESETSKKIEFSRRTEEERIMFQKYWPKPIAEIILRQYVKAQKANITAKEK